MVNTEVVMSKKYDCRFGFWGWFAIIIILGCCVLGYFSGCSSITEEQKQQVKEEISKQVKDPENQQEIVEQIKGVLK